MAKRKTSESVRKMRLVILGLSVALILAIVAVTWFTLSREAENGELQWKVSSTTTTSKKVAGEPDETTTAAGATAVASDTSTTTGADGLPYSVSGSDLYAEWNGKYPSAEVIVKKDDAGVWSAFVNDKKVKDCTGVYCNEYGWWFVRNGEVDFHYTGIAANEQGKWYVERGKCDFSKNGTLNYSDTGTMRYYVLVEGNVVRES